MIQTTRMIKKRSQNPSNGCVSPTEMIGPANHTSAENMMAPSDAESDPDPRHKSHINNRSNMPLGRSIGAWNGDFHPSVFRLVLRRIVRRHRVV